MASPTDYLLASATSMMRGADNSAFETASDLKAAIENEYPAHLDDVRLDYLARQLARLGFITVTNDPYGGDYISPLSGWGVSHRLNRIREKGIDDGLLYVLEHGRKLINRAFENDKFWTDLDSEIASPPVDDSPEIDGNEAIPTADGLVTLSHNQFKEIDEPTGALLEQLDRDNGIPDHPGLKERLAGQIRAGRELLRAGEFQLGIFRTTMLAGLQELSQRYGDTAIGVAASALVTMILHVLGLPGF